MAKKNVKVLYVPKAEKDGNKQKRLLIALAAAMIPAIYYSLTTVKQVPKGASGASISASRDPTALANAPAPRPAAPAQPAPGGPPPRKEIVLPKAVYTGPADLPRINEGNTVVEPIDLGNLPEGSRVETMIPGSEFVEDGPPDTKVVKFFEPDEVEGEDKKPDGPPPPPGVGATQDEVVKFHGSPEAQINSGEATILYFKEGEFEIRNGVVTRMKWKGQRTGQEEDKIVLKPVRQMAGTIEFKPADPRAVAAMERKKYEEERKLREERAKGLKVISRGENGELQIQKVD